MSSPETVAGQPDPRPVLLEVRDVVVHYGRIKALHSVSLTVHGALIGWRWADPAGFDRLFRATPLEVILVNARADETPLKAQALAQAHLAGGGSLDRGRATSLHLFEHVHGDSRDRGPAMIDLAQTYEAAGLYLAEGELPDYLPVVLQYASTQPPAQARAFLAGDLAW